MKKAPANHEWIVRSDGAAVMVWSPGPEIRQANVAALARQRRRLGLKPLAELRVEAL